MFKKFTYRLLFISSLLLLAINIPVLAAAKTVEEVVSMQATEKININQATNQQLAMIKGLGTKKAQAIIDYRESHGHFVSLQDLLKVKGIGKGTLQKIEPFLAL